MIPPDFYGVTGSSGLEYPPPAFYFQVVFAAASGISDTSFQEVSGISSELETEDVTEGGENRFVHRLPKALKHPKLTLKRGIAKDDSPLVKWCRKVLDGELNEPIVPQLLQVYLMNEKRNAIRAWSFAGAYPINWEIEDFNSTKNDVAIEKIDLSYTYSSRMTLKS